MSELIVRMENPKCCDDCVANYAICACGISGALWFHNPRYKEFDPSKERLPDCPIVCVLPEQHGDLIDRDEFAKNVVGYSHQSTKTIGLALDATPIIVPATERSET